MLKIMAYDLEMNMLYNTYLLTIMGMKVPDAPKATFPFL